MVKNIHLNFRELLYRSIAADIAGLVAWMDLGICRNMIRICKFICRRDIACGICRLHIRRINRWIRRRICHDRGICLLSVDFYTVCLLSPNMARGTSKAACKGHYDSHAANERSHSY